MGFQTTDKRNPGILQVEKFSVGGGLANNVGDPQSSPVEFLILKDCLIDKRLGVLLKRPGSLTETLTSGLGRPLGIGEYTLASSGDIPIESYLLANFGGTTFYAGKTASWETVSKTAYVNFSHDHLCQFAKLGSNLFIAGGLPAKWGGKGTVIDRVGIIAPTTAITVTSTAVAGPITLVDGAIYVYTYYNSTTGLESDWSPLSTTTGAISAKQIDIAIPAATATNWDKIRIYRCLDGGTRPYLVTTVNAGTTTYSDTTLDAALTTKIDSRYNKAVPPTETYMTAKFAQCIWYVDATNPYKLVFSKPYIGYDVDLEYFPINNYVMSNEPITGLLVTPGKLLVFHPRSISQISGFSKDDFAFNPFLPGVGTLFANSISTNGTDVVFLGEEGFVSIPISGGPAQHLSREIDLDLQTVLVASYNSSLYISSCWNPSLRQFIFILAAYSGAGSPWERVTDFVEDVWERQTDAVIDGWETTTGAGAVTNVLKVRIWGYSPELSDRNKKRWMEYTHPSMPDGGSSYPMCVIHPHPASDTLDPQQDKTYIGYYTGSEGRLITMFRRDKSQDDATTITSYFMTGRISPGEDNEGYKMFHGLGFGDAYEDPTSDSLCTLQYLLDFADPHLRSYAGSLKNFQTDSVDIKKCTDTLGSHLHIYGVDTSASQSKILLGEFYIHWRERFRKQGR